MCEPMVGVGTGVCVLRMTVNLLMGDKRRGALRQKLKSRDGARNQFQEPSLELSSQAT